MLLFRKILTIVTAFLIGVCTSSAQVVLTGDVTARAVGNVNLNINADLEIKTDATLQNNSSSTISVSGDYTRDGSFSASSSTFIFDGNGAQSFSGGTTFSNLIISKPSGTITLDTLSNVTVQDNLTLSSTTEGIIYGRDRAVVFVNGSSSRTGTGHVDGTIAQRIEIGDDANKLIPIGMDNDYVPLEFDIGGAGGSQGYVEFYAEDLDQNVAPSTISIPEVVERQWILSEGAGFDLGGRDFDLDISYINPDDLRNGADPDSFLVARKTSITWTLPTVGSKTASSVQSLDNDSLGLFIVGPEAEYLTFYSRETGNFSDGNNWSLYDFGSYPSPISPRTQDISNIGDSDTITLDANISTVANRGVFLVEGGVGNETGALFAEDFVIGGSGTFSMVGGSTLGVGSDEGITATPATTGNIQTAVREYNLSNHNDGIFVYNSAQSGALDIGDGFPTDVQDLIVRSSGTVTLDKNINISDDLLIESGGLDIGTYTVSGGDAFQIDSLAYIAIGGTNNFTSVTGFNSYLLDDGSIAEFNGSNQTISTFPANFNIVDGYGNVWIRNSGVALVDAPILVRQNLVSYLGSAINNTGVMSSITIYEKFDNNGTLTNSSAIYIGE